MKAFCIAKKDDKGYLALRQVPQPIPVGNDVRVKIYAVGLNPSDFQTMDHIISQSTSTANVFQTNIILGLDIAGIVDEVGPGVTKWKKGDRVYCLREISNIHGGFAEYSLIPEKHLVALPEEISFVQAAASPGAGFTAYVAIEEKLKPKENEIILIHGGAGGVGSYAIQLAKRRGLIVYTTCLARDIEYVKSLGADVAVDFQQDDVHALLQKDTAGEGIPYVLSSVGSQVATKDLKHLAFNGEMVVTAGLPNLTQWQFYDRQLSVHEIAFGRMLTIGGKQLDEFQRIATAFTTLLAKGVLRAPKITEIPFDDIPKGLDWLRKGEVTGKIVATLN
ncbi:alcohol dehydrogenase catalytic domain-containing protein [Streptococcus pluranimalium]|uniref:alcohol dehydrogenase catalytic domain-containing protein n=1 Tax=Streptococcus pluranimalium TaxID=82348 RepID=UPI0039FBE573